MSRSEYRRDLIMLRALQRGFAGHARLECRTTAGNLYFSVREEGQAGELRAALVGVQRGGYYAADLGRLQADSRGQAALNAAFDPRNIAGRALKEYRLVIVSEKQSEVCEPVLSGNLNGSFAVDWAAVRNAVCRLYPEEAPASPAAETEAAADAASAPESAPLEETRREIRIDVRLKAPQITAEATEVSDSVVEPAPADEGSTAAEAAPAEAPGTPESGLDAPAAPPAQSAEPPAIVPEAPAPAAAPAAELLALAPEAEWPEAIQSVRPLFASESPFQPFAAGDYVFVRAPMPADSGYAECAIGLQAPEGKPTSICYALPGRAAPEPPPGLEGYVWRGGAGAGWWAIFLDAATGEELDPPEQAAR